MSEEITFYDLPSKGGDHCWSPNTWKTRIYLNYKGLPYKTVWLEYPDIKPTLQGHVTPDHTRKYSLPTVLLADGTYIMDSQQIATDLEKKFSTPSVHLDSPYVHRLQSVLTDIIEHMRPTLIPQVPKLFLNAASVPYFNETRSKAFGMPLEQLEIEKGGEPCYAKARPLVRQVTSMLRENSQGPFFAGKEVTYADLLWVSYLRFVQKIGHDFLSNLVAESPQEHLALLDACQIWLERDNY